MSRLSLGRATMTVVLMLGTGLSFVLDWSANHLLNPLWHPHAKFHGALLLFLLAGVSATSLWSMWRPSREPDVAVRMAALLSLSFWTPLFYITSVLPGSTSWAGTAAADPRLHGNVVTPNLIVALAFIAVDVVVLLLAQSPDATPAAAARARR